MLGTLRWVFGYGSSDSSENEIKKERPNVVNDKRFYDFVLKQGHNDNNGNIVFDAAAVSELLASCNGKFFEEKILSDTISLSRDTYLQIASDSFSKNFLYFVQTCYQPKQINGGQSAEGEFDVGDAGIFGKFISKFESHQNMMRLFSSKLFAEFWGIVAEQFDDISASEAGEYTYEISQYMTNAINGQIYDESQFFRSVLSILITVYVKHKIVAEDLYNTKYSLFANLIQNSPIEKIINDLNIVIYLRNSAPEYDPNTRTFGKLPEIENLTASSKIDLNFIHVDYEANSVDTMNFWYQYPPSNMKTIRENLTPLLSSISSPQAVFTRCDTTLKFYTSNNLKKSLNVKMSKAINNLLSQYNKQGVLISSKKSISYEAALEEIIQTLNFILESTMQNSKSHVAERLKHHVAEGGLDSSVKELFDKVIEQNPRLARYIELTYSYKSEGRKISADYVKLFDDIHQNINNKSDCYKSHQKDGSELDENKLPILNLDSNPFTHIFQNGDSYEVAITRAGDIVIRKLRSGSYITLNRSIFDYLSSNIEQFIKVIDSGIVTFEMLGTYRIDCIKLLFSPIGIAMIDCLVKLGNFQYLPSQGSLQISPAILTSISKILELRKSDNIQILKFLSKSIKEETGYNLTYEARIVALNNLLNDHNHLDNIIEKGRYGILHLLAFVSSYNKHIARFLDSATVERYLQKQSDHSDYINLDLLKSDKVVQSVLDVVNNELQNHCDSEYNKRHNLYAIQQFLSDSPEFLQKIVSQKGVENIDVLQNLVSDHAMKVYSNNLEIHQLLSKKLTNCGLTEQGFITILGEIAQVFDHHGNITKGASSSF